MNAHEEYHSGGISMAGLNPRITVEPGKMGASPAFVACASRSMISHRTSHPE